MVRLLCQDYGFDCTFESDDNVEVVLSEFGKHMLEEHGIEYSKEALMQFILHKR